MNAARRQVRAYVAVGSNIQPMQHIPAAWGLLGEIPAVCMLASSRFWRTHPLGRADQPDFVNGAWAIATDLDPKSLRERLRAVEDQLGRVRLADKNAPRPIDLDLVLYGLLVDPAQRLPHPDLARPFVYHPVMELLAADPNAEAIRQLVRDVLGPDTPADATANPPGVLLTNLTALLQGYPA